MPAGQAYPDAWMDPVMGVRIRISAWRALYRIDDQFVERPRSLRLVWHYLRRVGPAAVIRKVRSRLAEGQRNRKVVALGVGTVLEAGRKAGFERGNAVAFIASNHPERPARDIVVLDCRFVRPQSWLQEIRCGATKAQSDADSLAKKFAMPYRGWSPFSGLELDPTEMEVALRTVAPELERMTREFPPPVEGKAATAEVSGRIEAAPRRGGRKSAVIFGLGNYAKTQIVPVVAKALDLECVHELDPEQFAGLNGKSVVMDSSPFPRPGERYDAWFVSGYHHTHAPLALEALTQGAYAVVEKPLATTPDQLTELLRALEGAASPRLFACFQKRYSILHEWAREDLFCGESGDAVDMYASVFEIHLPPAHWYNWPVSGSRMIANGCHWLDYFMCINDYAAVDSASVSPMRGGDLLAAVRLRNDARLVLSLTETGSARLGVRELVELRRGDATVRIADASRYEAESTSRILRRRKVNPVRAYDRMYRRICGRICAGEPGDRIESLRATELMLRLEGQVRDFNSTGKTHAAMPRAEMDTTVDERRVVQ